MTAIVVDTREGKPYRFPDEDVVREVLDVGDYTYDGYTDTFAVERKTLDDLAQSLGVDRDRFEREVERAQSLDEFAVVIEAPKEHVYHYRDSSGSPHYYSDMHPNAIAGTIEKWPLKYDTLNFYWCVNREKAKQKTLQLLDRWYIEYSQ